MPSFPMSASCISTSFKNKEKSMGDIISHCKSPISQLKTSVKEVKHFTRNVTSS